MNAERKNGGKRLGEREREREARKEREKRKLARDVEDRKDLFMI